MKKVEFRELILAYLHDPPDKALDIRGHEKHAAEYASRALGQEMTAADLTAKTEDIKASVEDRLPMPGARGKDGVFNQERSVDFLKEKDHEHTQRIHHPLSGGQFTLPLDEAKTLPPIEDERLRTFLFEVGKLETAEQCFLGLWRFLPEKMAVIDPVLPLLPADTRVPDHTIFNHLDLTAAFKAALSDGKGGALLSFSIGPVQGFIEQAKSLRDLWAGSYILSWLTFAAMKPVIESLGPTAVIFPALRGNALCDLWLRESTLKSALFAEELASRADKGSDPLLTGALPNTFLALVPASEVEELASQSKSSAKNAWNEICDSVHKSLLDSWPDPGKWDVNWADQVQDFWDLRTVAVPLRPDGKTDAESLEKHFNELLWKDCWPDRNVKELQEVIRVACDVPGGDRIPPGSWAMHVELAGRVMAAMKQIRQIPQHTTAGGDRAKCTLMGSFEQMGPGSDKQAEFWTLVSKKSLKGTYVRKSERLCAVALVKRFAWAAYFQDKLGKKVDDLRYSDTATVASNKWLAAVEIKPDRIRREHGEWSGQWIFEAFRNGGKWEKKHDDEIDRDPDPPEGVQKILRKALDKTTDGKIEKPRPYFAALVLDGDHMGKWLRGEKAPKLRETYHPKLVKYFEGLKNGLSARAKKALEEGRPVSPALHASITAALSNFARFVVPDTIDQYHGELVYAGGDDVLAILPTEEALACLRTLRDGYSGKADELPVGWLRRNHQILTLMGESATASAGLVVAHYKSDLRDTLRAAREAEKAAKNAGRDALGIAIQKRSGEHATVVCPWRFAQHVESFVKTFADGASDRWAYHLRQEVETLQSLPVEAIEAEIRRLVSRAEPTTREKLAKGLGLTDDPGEKGKKAKDKVPGKIAELYRELRHEMENRGRKRDEEDHNTKAPTKHQELAGNGALAQFVGLVQAASFLARGREE